MGSLSRSVALAAAALLAGCAQWPLHAALPEPWDEDGVVPFDEVATEDAEVADGEVQLLGVLTAPGTLTITGRSESCGWDGSSEWPRWPEHPVDLDGDGEADANRPVYAGWYAGDVDLFGLETAGVAWLSAELRWENEPVTGENAPYTPPDPGPWAAESDLDVVLLSIVEDGEGTVLRDSGFSRAAPETTGAPLVLDDQAAVVSVGCHHGLATDWTLTVTLQRG